VNLSKRTRHVVLAAIVAVAALAARPALAQFSLGSPGEPARLELGAGLFDITPSSHHKKADTAGDLRSEYHFGDMWWILSPFVGLEATTSGATYAYFGFGFDINLSPNWVITPNGAMGFFQPGEGTRLGSWWEFRTGAEVDYKFPDQSRLGLAVHHMSNAGLTQINPGEQSVVLTYHLPLR
jgi:lipid A 3-O-deacylase